MSKYIRLALMCLVVVDLCAFTVHKGVKKSTNDVGDLSKLASQITVQIVTPTGLGSGVWVSDEGYVATCWHVVEDSSAEEVIVAIGGENHVDLEKHEISTANFYRVRARVVDHDETADVAILKVSPPNPFRESLPNFPGLTFPSLAAAELQTSLPEMQKVVHLAGYPFGGPFLLIQDGVISGIGHEQEIGDMPRPEFEKLYRIFASVVSNPGNSGGPVLNGTGQVVGLLSGNLLSPVRDETGRQIVGVTAKLDAKGKVVWNNPAIPATELKLLNQNSGISVVVPAYFVKAVLVRAMATDH